MAKKTFQNAVLVAALAASAMAQIDVGSDGSDGVFNPIANMTVDLSLAASLCDCDGIDQGDDLDIFDDPCRWDCPSPVEGQGVYDAEQWAVVFKYSSVDIPPGVTVTFSFDSDPLRPRAPVVWLAQGDAVIDGNIQLSGAQGHGQGDDPHVFSESGPGGFRGGRGNDTASPSSGGAGPGGADTGGSAGASYGTAGRGLLTGPIYGNSAILPLIGGSGGNGGSDVGGGAGGGAILVAANFSIMHTGLIRTSGGISGGTCSTPGGAGSGGGIRLIADEVIISGALRAEGGSGVCFGNITGGAGRIRVEGNSISSSDPGDPLYVQDLPTFIFPPDGVLIFPDGPLKLRATIIEDSDMTLHTVPSDPSAIITDNTMVDVNIATSDPVTIEIEGEGISVGTCVDVRVVSASGPTTVIKSSPLLVDLEVDPGGDVLTATADVTFVSGFSVVQLRAFFGDGNTNCPAPPPQGFGTRNIPLGEHTVKLAANSATADRPTASDESGPKSMRSVSEVEQKRAVSSKAGPRLRDLRTLNGERIVRVGVGSTMGSNGTNLIYITETGRKIPVGR